MALNFPDSPGIGSVFTDVTSGFSWEWTGALWKSFTPAAAQNIKNLDDISSSFDNSETTFNLTINGVAYYPRAANLLQISLGGIIQEPDTDYTVDFTAGTITFTTAPNVGLDFFGVVRGTAVAIDYANDGNVQNKQNYTATEGQTAFTFSAGYNPGYLNVYRNGVKLRSTDFTETSSTVFTLSVPAQENDEIEAIGYVVASIVTTQGSLQNLNVAGVATVGSAVTINNAGIHVQSGIITASSFYGDGSNLTGIDATSLKDSGGNIKVQANPNGVVITGVVTSTSAVVGSAVTINSTGIDVTGVVTSTSAVVGSAVTINSTGIDVTGVVTATSFVGSGSGLTGVASTDNIITSTPAQFLDTVIVGSAVTINNTGIYAVSGIITAFDVDVLSDINYKENVKTVEDAIDKISKLRGVRFDWKETQEPSYGIIAQELEKTLPELVHGGNPKVVNYNGIIGVLIEAVKELSVRVNELENQ